jgi:hypothetical protein
LSAAFARETLVTVTLLGAAGGDACAAGNTEPESRNARKSVLIFLID